MDPESKKMLEEALELSRDNNEMIKRMRRSQKNSQLLRGLYWVLILAISFGGYFFVGPYLSKITSIYSSAYNNSNALQHLDTSSIQNFFKSGSTQPK